MKFPLLQGVVNTVATTSLPAGTTWSNGLPLSPEGALCISDNAVQTWSNGIPFDTYGNVVVNNGAGGGSGGAAIPAWPQLGMDFTTGILDSRITFTRTSNATYTDSAGVLRTTANNLALWSQTFQNAYWDKGLTTVVDNSTIAPDGTQTAALFSEAAGTGSHHIHDLTGNFTPTVGLSYCMSIYVKQPPTAADRYLQLAFWTAGFGANAYLNFDLVDKATETVGSAITSSGVEVLSAGWMRIWAVAPATVAAASGFQLAFVSSGTAARAESYAVTAGSEETTYIWGAQVAQSAVLTPYVRNVGTASGAPRFDYDPVTLQPKGLLIEQQSTNLLTYSDQFDNAVWTKINATVTDNAVVAPDGTTTADKLVESTANGQHRLFLGYTYSAGSYTISVYVKSAGRTIFQLDTDTGNAGATFNLSTGTIVSVGSTATAKITAYANGWYRCETTSTASAAMNYPSIYIKDGSGNVSYTGDGTSGIYIWGAQLEAGSFATSYIPTTTAQATRAADVAVMTGTNFSSWYNSSQGTVFAQFDNKTTSSFKVVQFDDGTNFNALFGGTNLSQVNSPSMTVTGLATYTAGPVYKSAHAYALNDFTHVVNGGTVATNSSGTPVSATTMRIGSGVSGQFLNGHLSSLAYYNTRLSNTQQQTLTA